MSNPVLGAITAITIVAWHRFKDKEPPVGGVLLVALKGHGAIRQFVYVGARAYAEQSRNYDFVDASDSDVWALQPHPWREGE